MYRKIKRYLKIYRILVKQEFKKYMEYKADFFVGIFGFLLSQAFNLYFIYIIFSRIPKLNGWSFDEIVFIYGFSLLPKGIDHLLSDNLWNFGHNIVRKGEFDKYITRPINSLFYIVSETIQVDAIGELIVGIGLVIRSMVALKLVPSITQIIVFILLLPFTALIYTSIKIITASLAFWVKKSGNITYIFYMLNDFAKYPVTIYNFAIKLVLTYLVPFALTSYYPASYLIKGDNLWNLMKVFIISTLFLVVAIKIWNVGVSKYKSAGS